MGTFVCIFKCFKRADGSERWLKTPGDNGDNYVRASALSHTHTPLHVVSEQRDVHYPGVQLNSTGGVLLSMEMEKKYRNISWHARDAVLYLMCRKMKRSLSSFNTPLLMVCFLIVHS